MENSEDLSEVSDWKDWEIEWTAGDIKDMVWPDLFTG